MKVKTICYIVLCLALFILECSRDDFKTETDFNNKYTVKIVDASSKEGMQKSLNDLYNSIQAMQHSLKISIIDARQKQSNFEYDLEKAVIESQAIGVDWKEKCILIRNKQREQLSNDQLMIKIQQDIINEETKKYKDLFAKYNTLFGNKTTNEVEQIFSQ